MDGRRGGGRKGGKREEEAKVISKRRQRREGVRNKQQRLDRKKYGRTCSKAAIKLFYYVRARNGEVPHPIANITQHRSLQDATQQRKAPRRKPRKTITFFII